MNFLAALLVLLGGACPAFSALPGLEKADEFQWLENGADRKVQRWSEEQNLAARAALDPLPGRKALRERLETLMKVGSLKNVVSRGKRIFYLKRSGLENQPVLYVRDGPGLEPRVLFDPNPLSPDGTISLDWYYPSQEGLLVAYGLSEKGSEDSTLRVREVDSGLDLPDQITRTRHASVAWLPDRGGFYYTRYPRKGSVPKGEEQYYRQVYFHTLGEDPLKDILVFGPGRAKEDWPDVQVSRDGHYLLISVSQGWSKTELYLRDLHLDTNEFTTLVEGQEAVYQGRISGDTLYILTNESAPRYKIMTLDLREPLRENWLPLIPEGAHTIKDFDLTGTALAVSLLEQASSRLRLYSLKGPVLREVPLPLLGTVSGLDGQPESQTLSLLYESFFVPPTLYNYDIARSSLTALESVPAPADLSDFETKQVRYESKDGTRVTMFLLSKKRLKRNRDVPTLLSGYGGFNISMTPTFSPSLLAWLEKGGLYALPNLRGGGEYGEAWHKAGMLGNKQNTFDDFIAAARWLIDEQYTRPERLAILGGSNGGLLVGAALTQAPGLFRAAVLSVPLLDMLRYHKFLLGRLWIPEYGSSEDPEAYQWLKAYSPYHHVQKGMAYPAALFLSGETDTRVDPMHARKMAASLRKNSSSQLPVLLRLQPKGGHGAGKPLAQTIDELTDRYSFLFWQLGVK